MSAIQTQTKFKGKLQAEQGKAACKNKKLDPLDIETFS